PVQSRAEHGELVAECFGFTVRRGHDLAADGRLRIEQAPAFDQEITLCFRGDADVRFAGLVEYPQQVGVVRDGDRGGGTQLVTVRGSAAQLERGGLSGASGGRVEATDQCVIVYFPHSLEAAVPVAVTELLDLVRESY